MLLQMNGTEDEILLSGTIISGVSEPFEGYICIEGGTIKEIGYESIDAHWQGIICPSLINGHTHLGDSIIKDPPFAPLSELVGPNGLKNRTLAQATFQELEDGMHSSLLDMAATGTCAFADFRENGQKGVKLLQNALRGVPLISRILGRPDPGSIDVHQDCWGIGISSTRDHPLQMVEDAVERARSNGLKVALHAGEAGRDDIQDALQLDPDFLVHLTKASHQDLKKVADAGIPVVICPRSNLITNVGLPPLANMLKLEINVGLGTDNVMLNSPNLFTEMELVSKAMLHNDRQVFNMCTLNNAKTLGIEDRVGSIEVGKESRIMVIDRRSNNMWGSSNALASVVRRARPSDILAVF